MVHTGSGIPWAAPLDLDLFTGYADSRQGTLRAYDKSLGTEVGYLEFYIETMSLVPEPSTALLVGLGLVGLAATRRTARRP